MKKILYIATLLFFSVAAKSQTYVADTTDLKLIPSVNNGKIATIVATAYQGSYRATNAAQTPNGANIFASSVKDGWYWVKIQDNNPSYRNVAIASKFKGIYSDGTEIDSADFHALVVATNNQTLYFPQGTYNLPTEFSLVEITANIDWIGDGDESVIDGLSIFRVKGNVSLKNIAFHNGGILFRQDAFTSGGEIDADHFYVRNVYTRNCQMLVRNVPGTNYMHYDKFIIDGLIMDTINSSVSGGAVVQWTAPARVINLQHGLVQYNTDSNYVSLIRLAGANNGLDPTPDTAMYINDWEFRNIITSATNAPAPVTNKLIMTINGEGADVITENIKIYNCNLPQIDLRGSETTVIMDGWVVNCPSVVSTATGTDYFLINKSRKTKAGEYAFIMRGCDIFVGDDGAGQLAAGYFENNGDRFITTTNWEFKSTGTGIRVILSEVPTHYNTFKVSESSIVNSASSGRQAFWFNDDIAYIEFDDVWMGGGENIFGLATTIYQTQKASFNNVTFHRGFQTSAQRDILHLEMTNCTFNGVDAYNFSSKVRTNIQGCVFEDDTTTAANSSGIMNFLFGNATSVDFIGNTFALDSVGQLGNISFTSSATGLDSLRFNENRGYIRTSTVLCIPIRVNTIDYVEVIGNSIEYKNGLADASFVYIEAGDTIDYAYVDGNRLRADGTGLDFFFSGGAGSYINNLKWGDNELLDAIEDGNITTVFDNITVHNAVDKDGNAYTTGDTLAFYQLIPDVITASSNRDLASSDVENRVRCTTSITLTIPLNFSAMAVEQTITILKAFSGTNVTVTGASGVTVNGSSGGSATITGDYKAGIIYKVSTNTYEVY